jgi:hypothetical protein
MSGSVQAFYTHYSPLILTLMLYGETVLFYFIDAKLRLVENNDRVQGHTAGKW